MTLFIYMDVLDSDMGAILSHTQAVLLCIFFLAPHPTGEELLYREP